MINIDEYPILKEHITTLKKTSKDNNHKNNIEYMTNSKLPVINFDKVAKAYAREHNLKILLTSNDAVFLDENSNAIFIEFKNGNISKEELDNVKQKLYESVLMLLDILDEKISYSRDNIRYILVYNGVKNSRVSIGTHIAQKAGNHFIEFGLSRFKGLCLKDIYTYTKEEFEEKFVKLYDKKV